MRCLSPPHVFAAVLERTYAARASPVIRAAMPSFEPRRRCIRGLQDRLGDEIFWEICAFTPMSCWPNVLAKLHLVAARILASFNAAPRHYLERYLDEPEHSTHKISAFSFARAIFASKYPFAELDEDGIFALFVMRDFEVSWSLPDVGTYGEVELDNQVVATPLFMAASSHKIGSRVAHLLLSMRADPCGYQWQHYGLEIAPFKQETPLWRAVEDIRPEMVRALLVAAADPDDHGMEMHRVREDYETPGAEFHRTRRPLWCAVENAIVSEPDCV